MMHKLRAMLCRVSDVAAKLASNLPRPLMFPSLFLLVLVAVVALGVLPRGPPIVSMLRLGRQVIIVVRVTSPASSSSFALMRRGATAIKSSEGMLCIIYR
jgi:hypothetical protein